MTSNSNINADEKPGSQYAEDYPSEYFSMVFNLSKSRHFPSNCNAEDISYTESGREAGPRFSKALRASAFTWTLTDPEQCSSSAECDTYEIGYDDNKLNKLTNENDGAFTISELEIWEITGCIVDGEYH